MATARLLTRQDWLALAPTFGDHNFEQSLTYAEAAAARVGAVSRLIAVEDDDQVLAIANVRVKAVPGLGRGIAWIPSGPLTLRRDRPAPDADQLAEILGVLNRKIAGEMGHILRLRLPGQAPFPLEVVQAAMAGAGFRATIKARDYHSAVVDLTRTEAELMAALHAKWRSNLRHALKVGISTDTGDTPELRRRFLQLYAQLRQDKGFQVDIPPEFYFGLTQSDLKLEILIVHKDGADLGASVIAQVGDSAVYAFAATPDVGRDLRAGYFLTWESIGRARAMGARQLDLGGIDPGGENATVARFKVRINAAPFATQAYEASGGGPVARLILGLEALHRRVIVRKGN